MPSTQAKPHLRLKRAQRYPAGLAAGVFSGLITGLFFLPPLAAIAVGCGVALAAAGALFVTEVVARLRPLEAAQRKLRDELPEHLAKHDAAIERLGDEGDVVVKRVERLERQLLRPDLRELTDLATQQGWEWWRGSDVVRFASPSGIELTFELPVEDGERRVEIARQLEAFGLSWSAPPTRITASQTDRSRR